MNWYLIALIVLGYIHMWIMTNTILELIGEYESPISGFVWPILLALLPILLVVKLVDTVSGALTKLLRKLFNIKEDKHDRKKII